jgi:Mrp family chromosome partitioning ATPase
VAALFAEALARVDMRVLLVDADLHRPRVSSFAGVTTSGGLSRVLRQTMDLRAAVQRGWVDGLALLPTAADREGGDLIATRFGDVVAEARERFDVIVVDTPPLIGTDDARTLLTMAGGALLVVGAGSHESDVNEALLAIEALHAPMLGIVANKLPASRSYYY